MMYETRPATGATDELEELRRYAGRIVETIREPLVVLDDKLRVKNANRAFYQTFWVKKEETEGALLFSLGNGQRDIPARKGQLQRVLPRDSKFEDFEVEHDFPHIGARHMLLNARRIYGEEAGTPEILLADDDDRLLTEEALKESRISNDPTLRQIPVVVLTTSKAEEDIYRTYDLGANSFITKPVLFESLVRIRKGLGTCWFEIVELPFNTEAQDIRVARID